MSLRRVKLLPHVFEKNEQSIYDDMLYNGYTFKTKLTNELLAQVCIFLEEGLPPTTACEYIGISYTTHYSWINKGANYISALDDGNKPPKLEWKIYAIYLLEVKKAIAKYLKKKIDNVNGNFTPAWVRDITILERRDSKNWGRNITTIERDESKNPDESFL